VPEAEFFLMPELTDIRSACWSDRSDGWTFECHVCEALTTLSFVSNSTESVHISPHIICPSAVLESWWLNQICCKALIEGVNVLRWLVCWKVKGCWSKLRGACFLVRRLVQSDQLPR